VRRSGLMLGDAERPGAMRPKPGQRFNGKARARLIPLAGAVTIPQVIHLQQSQ
jgi:hypothetical protein